MQPLNREWLRLRQRMDGFWLARSGQERKLLTLGGAVAGLALFYSLLIAPAVDGRARLRHDLPQLRQEAAEIAALARQAAELKQQTPPPVPPMSRASLAAALAARGLNAQSIGITGDYAKLQLSGVPFAGLSAWLDALRREQRIAVQEASIVAQSVPGMVDASLTLVQSGSQAP